MSTVMIPAPAAAREISRESLVHQLYEAAELEHNLMCTYLYAAFSLKTSADDGLSAAEAEATNRWRRDILKVAVEEMGACKRRLQVEEAPEVVRTAWEKAYQRFETPGQEQRKFRSRLRSLGVHRWSRTSSVLEICSGRGNGLIALASSALATLAFAFARRGPFDDNQRQERSQVTAYL